MLTDCADAKERSVQLLHILESKYKVLTDCADAKERSVQLLHTSESKYNVLTDCADAKVDQFNFYEYQYFIAIGIIGTCGNVYFFKASTACGTISTGNSENYLLDIFMEIGFFAFSK